MYSLCIDQILIANKFHKLLLKKYEHITFSQYEYSTDDHRIVSFKFVILFMFKIYFSKNMMLWHIEYFKLKEFKKQKVRILGTTSSPVKQVLRPLHERGTPYAQRQ